MFVDLQRAVCVGAPQGVGGVDGGGGQSFGHGHLHVHAGQVHDYRLRAGGQEKNVESSEELEPSCITPVLLTMEQQ